MVRKSPKLIYIGTAGVLCRIAVVLYSFHINPFKHFSFLTAMEHYNHTSLSTNPDYTNIGTMRCLEVSQCNPQLKNIAVKISTKQE